MSLNYEEQGSGEPVVLVHGLFGSAVNLRGIAKILSDHFRVVSVDLPNHGRSGHTQSMTYADMSAALLQVMHETGIGPASWVGHSMGGKAVMDLSLSRPDAVTRLVVMDIAPVQYTHTHAEFIDAMSALDLSKVKSRADADRALSEAIADTPTRLFLLQNLVMQAGSFRWRLNLPVLRQYLDEIMSFPDHAGSIYEGPVLVLNGEHSGYVREVHREVFLRYFPEVTFETIPGAGHWLHAEQPDAVCAALIAFLAS